MMGWIKTALIWFVFINSVLSIFYHLYQVYEGKHEHIKEPEWEAVFAVLETIFSALWLIFVILG